MADMRAWLERESSSELERRLPHTLNDGAKSKADDEFQAFAASLEMPRIVWHWVWWASAKTFDGMEFAGEVLANFLGLNQSKYQWILDMKEREKEEKRQRQLEKRQRRQLCLEQLLATEQQKLQELEAEAQEQDSISGLIETHITV